MNAPFRVSDDSPDGKLTLISWYVNSRRVLEIIGPGILSGLGSDVALLANFLGPRVLEWIRAKNIPSLLSLILSGRLAPGSIFTHEATFFSKGMSELDLSKPKDAKLYVKLGEQDPEHGRSLDVLFNTANLTTASAFGALKGRPGVYVCGVIDRITDEAIEARPLVIGSLALNYGAFSPRFADTIEVHAQQFDALNGVDFTKHVTKSQLDALQSISEQAVKEIFARLMLEPVVDKDWGGEQCDLFASNARIQGNVVPCAFAFKGPGKFKKLEPRDCGKNGDQIYRLFQTPAECFIFQHCHQVSPAVRATMKAFALERLSQRGRFCIIDGFQTYSILRDLKLLS